MKWPKQRDDTTGVTLTNVKEGRSLSAGGMGPGGSLHFIQPEICVPTMAQAPGCRNRPTDPSSLGLPLTWRGGRQQINKEGLSIRSGVVRGS